MTRPSLNPPKKPRISPLARAWWHGRGVVLNVLTILVNDAVIGTRRKINFSSDFSGNDDPSNDEVEVSLASGVATTDEKVKVTSNDTVADYLLNKLTAGDAITITEVNDSGDEDAQIAVNFDDATSDPTSVDDTAADDGDETTPARKNHRHQLGQHGVESHDDDFYSISFVIDGGGSAITTGIKGHVETPVAGNLVEWRLLLDQSDTMTVDIDYDTYANYPTVGNNLVAPATSGVQKNQATGLSTSVAAESILEFDVTTAPSSAERATVVLKFKKT